MQIFHFLHIRILRYIFFNAIIVYGLCSVLCSQFSTLYPEIVDAFILLDTYGFFPLDPVLKLFLLSLRRHEEYFKGSYGLISNSNENDHLIDDDSSVLRFNSHFYQALVAAVNCQTKPLILYLSGC